MIINSMTRADARPGLIRTSAAFHFNPRAPLRDLRECAKLMGITYNQAQYLERLAFTKLRAALAAYGYHHETGMIRR